MKENKESPLSEGVKALFFAQYLGQQIEGDPQDNEDYKICQLKLELDGLEFAVYEHCVLLLRSIDQLTDEESDMVYTLSGQNLIPSKVKQWLRGWQYQPNINYSVYQYILRIGVLMPFTYLDKNNKPITLQHDEIISLGWAKYLTP